jgi:hypothetical protein
MEITLSQKQIENLHINEWDKPSTDVKGYEGWYILDFHDDGEYDGEKGSMNDFSICLYDPDDNLIGEAIGGYYTGMSGFKAYGPLTFKESK